MSSLAISQEESQKNRSRCGGCSPRPLSLAQAQAHHYRLPELLHDIRQLWGCGYGTSAAMRLLRQGCRAHRLAAGVARIGSDLLHHPLLAGCPWPWRSAPRHRCWWALPPAGRPRLAALPADWQEHPVLRHTARELGRMGGSQQLEG